MRPYFSHNLKGLTAEFADNFGDLAGLRKLLAELERRKTQGAQELKKQVSRRILEVMEAGHSASSDGHAAPTGGVGEISGNQVDQIPATTVPVQDQDPSATGVVQPSGSQVDNAADTLLEIRQRLLDLSRRNTLLNYKHPPGKSLRVVDEVPGQLVERLLNGDSFVFEPLPRVPLENEEMPQHVRKFLESQNNWRKPSRSEWAQMHDIEPNYDLPMNSTRKARHTDLVIQTLLFPDELEARLRSMAALARTAIEESGANILNLAIGFLEWREAEHSEASSLAPLILIPVTLQKAKGLDAQTRREKFRLEYSGEDLQSNLSLRERLRNDFGLILPDLEDDDTPEKYLQRCKGLLEDNVQWALHRFVSLGFFQFGKLLMYLDLDPDRWPDDDSIAEHPLVKQVLEGASDSGIGGGAPVQIDDLPLDVPETQLIESADSSQHQAIIDAAAGRNMVIEGPPGTGKSQTITNIIGVCLAQGKSVLFVSEKLAALEVVRSRLEKAGLGDFCLELHSHKTQKRKFLDDLEKRDKRRRRGLQESDGNAERSSYKKCRSDISQYLKAVYTLVDTFGLTRQDLFCRVAELGVKLPDSVIDGLPDASDAKLLDAVERARTVNFAKEADRVRTDIERQYGDLAEHPWYGLIPKIPDGAEFDGKKALSMWLDTIRSLERHAHGSGAAMQTVELRTLGDFEAALAIFELLDKPICEMFDIEQLSSIESAPRQIAAWLDQEKRLLDAAERAGSTWRLGASSVRDTYIDVAAATGLLDAEGLRLSRKSAKDIADIANCLSQLSTQIDVVADGILRIERALGCPCGAAEQGIESARNLLHLSARKPSSSMEVRQPILQGIRDYEKLTELCTEHRDLVKSRGRLSLQFKLDDPLDLNRLDAAASVLGSAKGLSILRSDWRAANAAYQAIRHKKTLFRSSEKKAQDIRDVLQYLKLKREFEQNREYAAMLGPLFISLDTRVDDIWQICTWNREIRNTLGDEPNIEGVLGRHLMGLAEDRFGAIDSLASTAFPNASEFMVSRLKGLNEIAPEAIAYILVHGWNEVVERLQTIRDRVVQASDRISLHCVDPSANVEQGEEILRAILALQAQPERLAFHDRFLASEKTDVWGRGEILLLEKLASVAERFDQESPESVVARASVVHANATADAREKANEVARIYGRVLDVRSRVGELFWVDEEKFFSGPETDINVDEIVSRLDLAQIEADQIADWKTLASLAKEVRNITGAPVQAVLFDAGQRTGTFTDLVRYVTLATVAINEAQKDPVLSKFGSDRHNKLLAKFREMDDRLRWVASRDIGNRLVKNPIPAGRTGTRVGELTEMALLRHEMQKQRRHVPIRKLLHRAGNALIGLKPCFMMGPLSVAQYLAPGRVSFDVVIMDEASQMRPEDALGAIARGRQLIVVGDPKQLPPTSFFDRLNQASGADDDEDEQLTFGSQESILDIAAPILESSKSLSWHYRSQHQDLIAFSNHCFYDDNLLLFPTAHAASDHLGVEYHRVDGSYSNQTNEDEAQRLITDVIHEVKSGRKRSIGIVAINAKQAQVLRDIWDRNLREMPEIEELLGSDDDDNVLDSLFIKNLENVQGDERDVIFISLTYGKDPNGNFYQRFGPINRDNGWRRLNVLFTRAKQQMKVYSSMDSSMIVPGERATRGVISLKEFLIYCETRVLPETADVTGRDPDSPFEEDVAAEVRNFGLEIEYQVGVAGFFIDIGVYDAREPRHFLMGIECDGAAYHSSQSARDRDKIRQEMLENLGWRIYRIWSTDWFQQSLKERGKLRSALKAAKLEADSRAESRAIKAEDDARVDAEETGRFLTRDTELPIPAEPVEEVEESLRSRFLELRRTLEEEFPDVRPEHSLLSDNILELLLRYKPTSVGQFHQTVPFDLRQQIDLKQSRAYLSTVMLMMEDA